MVFIIYWLGIKGYISHLHSLAYSKKAGTAVSMSTGTIQEAALLLQKSMQEDKMYLNPDLNLHAMAQHTGLPQKTISVVLNQHIGKSFTEFVNQYRVESLKEKLKQPAMSNFTITAIAMECGFNSKASFQRIFKDVTGSSPSKYRKSLTDKGK